MKKTIKFKLIFATATLGLASGSLVSCNFKSAPYEPTYAEVYGDKFAEKLRPRVVAAGFSEAVVDDMKAGAIGAAGNKKTLDTVMPLLVTGAMTQLGKANSLTALTLAATPDKLAVIDDVVAAAFEVLKGDGFEYSREEQRKIRGSLAKSALAALKATGISAAEYEKATKIIAETSVAILKESGVEDAEIKGTVAEISVGMAKGLKDGGFSLEDVQKLAGENVRGAVISIEKSGVPAEEYESVAADILSRAVGNLEEMASGLSPKTKIVILGDLVLNAVSALGETTFDAATKLKLLKAMVESAVGILDDAEFKGEDLHFAMKVVSTNAIKGLEKSGLADDAADYTTYGLEIVDSTLTGLSDVLDMDDSIYAAVLKATVQGVFEGFVGAAGVDKTQLASMSDDFLKEAISSLDDAEVPDDLVLSSVSALTKGITAGMEEFGLTDGELTALTTGLQTAAQEGVSDLDYVFTTAEYDSVDDDIDTAMDAEIADDTAESEPSTTADPDPVDPDDDLEETPEAEATATPEPDESPTPDPDDDEAFAPKPSLHRWLYIDTRAKISFPV